MNVNICFSPSPRGINCALLGNKLSLQEKHNYAIQGKLKKFHIYVFLNIYIDFLRDFMEGVRDFILIFIWISRADIHATELHSLILGFFIQTHQLLPYSELIAFLF